MNLTISPPFYGGYNYHIGTNSSYFINANGATGTVYYKCHLYCWSGARIITTPLEPIVTIEKEVLNQHSYYFDISDYLKILIEPEIHDFLNSEDYDCGYKWVCWKIEYFDGLSNLIHTYSSPQYFASAGFRWNEYVPNAPDVDSTGQEYPIYAGTDKQYKLQHLPIKKNDLGIYYNFLFTSDRTHSNSLVEYYDYVEEEKTANECAYDFQVCFINRFGAFEYFPLYGKVVQSTAMSKTHYNSVVPNYGYLRLINYKPELTQKSENKYSWSSSQLDEMFYLKIEEINHSPLLFMYNCDTRKIEQVYISSNNYMQKTFKNDKNKQTYNIEFTSVHNKKK